MREFVKVLRWLGCGSNTTKPRKEHPMNIVNRTLTLNPLTGNGTYECIAGCKVELNMGDVAQFALPNFRGYTLTCYLEGVDVPPNPHDHLHTFVPEKNWRNVGDLIDMDHVFRAELSRQVLNEDAGSNDEIRAVFVLTNNSTGEPVTKRSVTRYLQG